MKLKITKNYKYLGKFAQLKKLQNVFLKNPHFIVCSLLSTDFSLLKTILTTQNYFFVKKDFLLYLIKNVKYVNLLNVSSLNVIILFKTEKDLINFYQIERLKVQNLLNFLFFVSNENINLIDDAQLKIFKKNYYLQQILSHVTQSYKKMYENFLAPQNIVSNLLKTNGNNYNIK